MGVLVPAQVFGKARVELLREREQHLVLVVERLVEEGDQLVARALWAERERDRRDAVDRVQAQSHVIRLELVDEDRNRIQLLVVFHLASPGSRGEANGRRRRHVSHTTAMRPAGAWRVYLTYTDYVLAPPGRFDRAESAFAAHKRLPLVPVLRVFGATPSGQRCCVHVHNVFPYCYVEYRGALVPEAVLPYIQKLGHALNRALAHALHQPTRDVQLIVAIHLCKGRPFYGYVEEPHYYLKISYADPALRTRLAALLAAGDVLGTPFQPMEAHVQYQLQWMLDYNLSGCDYMELDTVVLREDSGLPRDTYTALEGDAEAHHIANRRRMRAAHDARAGDEPLVPSLRGLWAQERSRRERLGLDPTPTPAPSVPHTDAGATPWVAAERHAAQLAARVDADAHEEVRAVSNMERYVLDTYATPELFHPHGLEAVARPDASGASAKMFDLDHVQSQGASQDAPPPQTTQVVLPTPPSPRAVDVCARPAPRAAPPPRKRRRMPRAPRAAHGWYTLRVPAPSAAEVQRTFAHFGVPDVEYTPPRYASTADVPTHAREYAQRAFSMRASTLAHLAPFEHWPRRTVRAARTPPRVRVWQRDAAPPSAGSVRAWLAERAAAAPTPARALPSSEAPCSSASSADAERDAGRQHMTTLALHALVPTRGDLVPDAREDAIAAVVYTLMQDAESDAPRAYTYDTGVVLVRGARVRLGLPCTLHEVDSELELLNMLVDVVRALDPEILAAYDVDRDAWAYVAARAEHAYAFDVVHEWGRARRRARRGAADGWTAARAAALRVQGRHVLSIGRLMQREVALAQYTLEAVVYHVLRRRLPHYTHATLSAWLRSVRAADVARAVTYAVRRVRCALELLERSELLFRTAEFARMYGIDFFSVLTRGSQFRVESVLLRITKLQSYVLPSPSRAQVGRQNAAECVPLVLEPAAAYYRDPVLVLDFQSLYPSMMIAYNLCYSTCLGRLAPFEGAYKLGFATHAPAPGALRRLHHHVRALPNGVLFVDRAVRESTLARMLREVLAARVMVKSAMRAPGVSRAQARRYQAQQLSLKLLANVTYGYTGATASGRMPCVEIADAIVQAGRETLERALALIEGTPAWGARVLYGDTDSLFVALPGRTRDAAFAVGRAIADAVTRANPEPVQLNFEKVYQPCVLVAKKRYVGYKWEAPAQARPVLDVKGLEIIRRDACLALQRMQEACVRLLFDTQDLSLVKRYCQRQWAKIYAGRVAPLHLVAATAVRLGTYAGTLPPGAALAARALLHDPERVPHAGERVPYLVRHGLPTQRLAELATSPHHWLRHPHTRLHADYYVRRVLAPALARIFNLLGVDVHAWVDEMPRPRAAGAPRAFAVEACAVCGQSTAQTLCADCVRNPEAALARAAHELRAAEQRQLAMHRQCAACADDGGVERPPCESLECPVAYARAANDALVDAHAARLAALELAPAAQDPWVW